MGDHLLAGTLYDGVVIQPKMVDSSFGKEYVSNGSKAAGAAVDTQQR
jgi:hypothetical protein